MPLLWTGRTYKSFGNDGQALHVKLVLTQVKQLECPVPLEYLGQVCDPRLREKEPLIHILPMTNDSLTRKSFPFKSSVRSAPSLGRLSSARTLSRRAALGPAELGGTGLIGTASLRVVTPPCELLVMMGTCEPRVEKVLVAVVGVPDGMPRFDLGT